MISNSPQPQHDDGGKTDRSPEKSQQQSPPNSKERELRSRSASSASSSASEGSSSSSSGSESDSVSDSSDSPEREKKKKKKKRRHSSSCVEDVSKSQAARHPSPDSEVKLEEKQDSVKQGSEHSSVIHKDKTPVDTDVAAKKPSESAVPVVSKIPEKSRHRRSRSRSRSRRSRKEHMRRSRDGQPRSRVRRSRSRERRYRERSRKDSHRRKRSRSKGKRSPSRRHRRRRRISRRRSRSKSRTRSRNKSPNRPRSRSPLSKKRRNEPLSFKEKLKQSFLEVQKQAAEGKLKIEDLDPQKKGMLRLSEKPSLLPLNTDKPLAAMAMGAGHVTPQQALLQTMAAMHQKAQELTGVAVPKYYNPAAVNPLKYAEQVQKRKLLWSKKEPKKDQEAPQPTTSQQWKAVAYTQDGDIKAAAKFRKLMGIKENETSQEVAEGPSSTTTSNPADSHTDEVVKKQEELFRNLDKEYEFARMTTHTHRGVGLGFASHVPYFPK